MKRVLKWLGYVVLALAVVLGGLWYSVFGSNEAIVDGQQLAPGVVQVKDGFVSVFVLDVEPGKVALVDAGNDAAATAILAALSRRGLKPDAVSAIFLTHGHPDHTRGYKQFPGAQIYALKDEVALVAETARVDQPMQDGDVVTLGDLRLEAFAAPGHTPGSAVFLARGVLFFGDSAGADKDGRFTKAVRLFTKDSSKNVLSLIALEKRLAPRKDEVKELAFAHTGPLAGFGPLSAFANGPH